MIDAPLALAFTAGLVAAFNPCGFAMLPAYLSWFLGRESTAGDDRASLSRAAVVGACMTVGFVVTFGVVGFMVRGLEWAIGDWLPRLTIVVGIALIPLGIALLAGKKIALATPRLQMGGKSKGLVSMVLYGISYATVSLSCTLAPFLATVAGTFERENVLSGTVVFVLYGLGMGLVVTALTVAVATARHTFVHRLRQVLPLVGRISGAFLILTGLYVIWYGYVEIRIKDDPTVDVGPVDWVTNWSNRISTWIDDFGALRLGWILGIVIVVAVVAERTRRSRARAVPEAEEEPVDAPV